EGTLVLGPALDRNAPPLPHSLRILDPALNRPDPEHLAHLALETWETGRRDDPFFLEPLYLRRSSAEEQWDRKAKVV
ncbi:tRNA (adenosine(37)-N6)-threonylcarbamoyltransferase complex dimerization subunit type 1 TsaB, partial [Singulisphaera rosea]